MTQVEVLSPAGSMESFKAAVNAGADAIYVGGNMFGARAYANNFNSEQLREAMDFAHIHGRKVYLTVNTLLKDTELEGQLFDFLRPAYENGLDAVIVQDFGVFDFVREHFPGLDIHASTQMTTNGVLSARFLQDRGASRIVTSRELSLDEIRAIKKQTSVEIESFVHGALCYCYSGQCLLSSMIGGRSGNRGRCAQPCRLAYAAYDKDNNHIGSNDKHILSPKDMCTVDILPDIIDAGVYSLKIEGRMKSPEYTAGVVAVYRKYVDLYLALGRGKYKVEREDIVNLMDLFNRGNFSKGYYISHNGPDMMSMERPNHQGTKAIEVISASKGKMTVKALGALNPQDVVEVSKDFVWTNGQTRKYGETFNINIPSGLRVKNGSVYYRTRNNVLLKEINDRYINKNVKEDIIINGEFRLGECARISADYGGFSCEVYGNPVEAAKNSPMGDAQIAKQLSKLGNTEFEAECVNVLADDNIFVPVQELNDLRRKLVAALSEELIVRRTLKETYDKNEVMQSQRSDDENHSMKRVEIYASVYNKKVLAQVLNNDYVKRIYFEVSETKFSDLKDIVELIHAKGKEAFLFLPYIFRKNIAELFGRNVQLIKNAGFDGFLIKNLDELQFIIENDIEGKRVLDFNVYRFNNRAIKFFGDVRIDGFTISLEHNRSEIKSMDNSDSEMIVYGYTPAMVSAQCVMKNLTKCAKGTGKENEIIFLKDRVGKLLPVVNNCSWCYNVIYNSTPLNLLDNAEEIQKCGISAVRLELGVTEPEQVDGIIKDAIRAFIDKEEVIVKGDYTRGHFLRGVE